MAFPVPDHLPRRPIPQDISSAILSKIGDASNQSLNASLASTWLTELDETILATKGRIHDRMHADLPEFERQFQSAKSVQARLQTLSSNVDALQDNISNPQTGLIPSLVRTLTTHANLAQEFADVDVLSGFLSHLQQCHTLFTSITNTIHEGNLPEAVRGASELEELLDFVPTPLKDTNVMLDLKHKFRAAKARTEEQLSDAYLRGIIISPSELIVHPTVTIPPSSASLPLSAVLSSLSPTALSNHTVTLRRDLTSNFIDPTLKGTVSITTEEHRISSSPSTTDPASRLIDLSRVLTFLSQHLFPILPPAFPKSLSKPVTAGVLDYLLAPSLPSSFSLLPAFLKVVQQAVVFEKEHIIGLLGNDPHDTPIKAWAEGVGGHYERQRRVQILDNARKVILAPEDKVDAFVVEVEINVEPEVIPVQDVVIMEDDQVEEAWGLDDEVATEDVRTIDAAENVTDDWGFGDDSAAQPVSNPDESEPDPDAAWGWNDEIQDDDGTTEESAWDDPWGDDSSTASTSKTSEPPPSLSPSISSPKVATRLEKLANKGKKPLNGNSLLLNSPVISSPLAKHASTAPSPPIPSPPQPKRPPKLEPPAPAPKETYLVSSRVKEILKIVADVLNEGTEFASARLTPSSTPGHILLQSAPSILDLYRALYPIVFGTALGSSLQAPIRFSNDCLYLSRELEKVERNASDIVKERLAECRLRLKVLGDSWLADSIEKQCQIVNDVIDDGAQGFTYTGDQDRYDECESAVTKVLQDVRNLAKQWRGIMTKSNYYTAIGSVADAALSCVLDDILALPDIPELESKRLAELCRILHSLEGLFVEDPQQPSFVVAYVPHWLKFSYLSELLEASMVDITYLFDSGALVDFDVEELTRLVQALFSDTQTRTGLINKLMAGHPTPSES